MTPELAPIRSATAGTVATSRWRGRDPWFVTAVVLVVVALCVGAIDTLTDPSGDPAYYVGVLAAGLAGLACAVRGLALSALVAAALIVAEVRDPAPVATWAVGGGLLFLFALRRPRLEAVTAGVVFVGAGVLAAVPWSTELVGGGVIGIASLATAAVGTGQWVQAQRRYEIAEVGRRREESERRREEIARHVAEERLRIARDLHDSVAHHIAVVSVQTNLARASLETSPRAADQALAAVQVASRSVLSELQLVLGVLRGEPGGAGETGPSLDALVDRLDDLVSSYRQVGLGVELEGLELLARMSDVAGDAVYRVLQEALTNAHRYGVGRAQVAFRASGADDLDFEVRNTVDPSAVAAAAGSGHGLLGMRERVFGLAGTLSAGAEGQDFVVRVRLPLVPEPEGGDRP